VKKHKLYAQCSGRIDATTFVKRSALLSSPATLNRDFGFLTGVERALGTALEEEDGGGGAVGRGRLEGFFKRSGVSVKWAPRGMKRAMENCTAVSKGRKGKHVVWTVEWIVLGSRGIGGEAERVLDRKCVSISPAHSFFPLWGLTIAVYRNIRPFFRLTSILHLPLLLPPPMKTQTRHSNPLAKKLRRANRTPHRRGST